MELNKLKRLASFALSAAVAVSFMPSVAFADVTASGSSQTFNDMPNNWATASLNSAVENGLLKGYKVADGMEIRPNGNITRAEFVTVVNRAFGATEKAALTGVTDVKNGAWYADEIAKAIGMQTMSKAEKVRPNDSITRQEAFTILARAYRQSGGTRNSFAKFTDSASVADFAVDGVGALVEKGYVNGADGKLNPTGYLTRAEFAKIMDNLTAAYVNTTAAYSQNVTGNVIVNTPGAKLKDMKINGNLIIADGVGEGDVDVENVAITGDIIVKAGGENSIHIANVTVGGTLVVNKVGGTVRIVASGTTNVKMVEVGSDVIITATDLKGGEIGTVKIDGSDVSDVVLRGDFKTVETAVKDVKITANEGKIGEFVMTEKATVTGASTIATVKNETNEAVSVNGKTVEAGKSTSSGTTDTPAATGGSTGGGGGASGGGGTGGGSGSGGGSGTGGGTTQPTTKYTITVSDTTNGTVTAAKTSNIEAGESVVITITPAANYQLNTIKVNGVDKTSSVADGKLTVTVNENLTVAATFESISTGGNTGGSETPTSVTSAESLTTALEQAGTKYSNTGETSVISIGESEITGTNFVVPAGVTLLSNEYFKPQKLTLNGGSLKGVLDNATAEVVIKENSTSNYVECQTTIGALTVEERAAVVFAKDSGIKLCPNGIAVKGTMTTYAGDDYSYEDIHLIDISGDITVYESGKLIVNYDGDTRISSEVKAAAVKVSGGALEVYDKIEANIIANRARIDIGKKSDRSDTAVHGEIFGTMNMTDNSILNVIDGKVHANTQQAVVYLENSTAKVTGGIENDTNWDSVTESTCGMYAVNSTVDVTYEGAAPLDFFDNVWGAYGGISGGVGKGLIASESAINIKGCEGMRPRVVSMKIFDCQTVIDKGRIDCLGDYNSNTKDAAIEIIGMGEAGLVISESEISSDGYGIWAHDAKASEPPIIIKNSSITAGEVGIELSDSYTLQVGELANNNTQVQGESVIHACTCEGGTAIKTDAAGAIVKLYSAKISVGSAGGHDGDASLYALTKNSGTFTTGETAEIRNLVATSHSVQVAAWGGEEKLANFEVTVLDVEDYVSPAANGNDDYKYRCVKFE